MSDSTNIPTAPAAPSSSQHAKRRAVRITAVLFAASLAAGGTLAACNAAPTTAPAAVGAWQIDGYDHDMKTIEG